MDLTLTPSGHLLLAEEVDSPFALRATGDRPAQATPTGSVLAPLRKAFEQGSAQGLLALITLRGDVPLPPACAWWRRFGERYLTALCHVPEPLAEPVCGSDQQAGLARDLKAPLPPPQEDLAALVDSAPPMRGGEYLRVETTERLWADLDTHCQADIAATSGGLSEWLRTRNPLWHRVGRVSFHLAENKRDPECPFAFLATYAPRLLDARRVQYLPLGKALQEYAGAKNKQALVNLLTPVQRASERCAWVKDLVDSGDVFHPLRWSPAEAHRFLKDVPALEEAGLLVRMPDWWTRRPPRVRVGVSLGSAGQVFFGADSLLDFRVRPSVDGEPLSEEEWQEVLAARQGLLQLKGRWVEVDRERLQEALDHWKQVKRAAGEDGVSFLEGMRLLAGAPIESGQEAPTGDDAASWSEVQAGPWLEERLREIREPKAFPAEVLANELLATLRPYQTVGVRWLWTLSRLGLGACLADDMGLGKTVQVLALLLLRKRERATDPAILVLPASLLGNWKAEIERFAPTLSVKFLHPAIARGEDLDAAQRNPKRVLHGVDAVFTTYGMLSRIEWLSERPWGLAVLDEAQAIKNPSARQTRAAKRLQAAARVVLTGTPVENRLGDLWSIFDFLCPGLLGSAKAFGAFVKRMEGKQDDPYAPLRRLVGPFLLRRLKTDKRVIADLPDKTEVRAYCRLTKRQVSLYEASVRELETALQGRSGIERRGVVLAFLMRFKQICNHPAQWLASGDYAPEDSGKFHRLRELCEEIAGRQEKALVFTQFREMTEPLARYLEGVFGRPGLVLHGQGAVGKRGGLGAASRRGAAPPFFVLSLKAGGTGLNLTAASHVIHFDRWWNPAVENQATDRAFRIGQKRNVMVQKFVCQGTVEERIDAMLVDKTELADQVLSEGAPKMITEMGDKELLDLVRLDLGAIEEE